VRLTITLRYSKSVHYEWLFSFVAFADRLNFTRAAEDLHISQPALHVQIKKLSEIVGRPLYRHQGRSLSLTREGARLAAFGREVKDRGREVLDEVRGVSVSGPAILASGQGAFLYLLGTAIRRFLKRKQPLRLLTMRGPEVIEAVRDARAHLGVAAAEAPPPDLDAVTLRTVGQIVVLPLSHRLARRSHLQPADLSGELIVVPPSGSPHRTTLANALAAAGANWMVAVEATGWELIVQFAQYGLGIAAVNDFVPVPRGMVGVPLRGVAPVTYYLLRRTGMHGRESDMLHKLIVETASA